MSSGGMDWAYRVIALHPLDPLGLAVVLHLGWRDAAAQRTDRGIAESLGQHRSSVRKATMKLSDMGLIVRRSGQWVAVETVAIVEEWAGHSVVFPGPLSGLKKCHSVAPKRKEKEEKERGAVVSLRDPLLFDRYLATKTSGESWDSWLCRDSSSVVRVS